MEFGGTYLFVETLIKEFLQSTQSTFLRFSVVLWPNRFGMSS